MEARWGFRRSSVGVLLTLSILSQVEGSEAVATVGPIDTMQVKNSLTVGVTAKGTMPWQVEIAVGQQFVRSSVNALASGMEPLPTSLAFSTLLPPAHCDITSTTRMQRTVIGSA